MEVGPTAWRSICGNGRDFESAKTPSGMRSCAIGGAVPTGGPEGRPCLRVDFLFLRRGSGPFALAATLQQAHQEARTGKEEWHYCPAA